MKIQKILITHPSRGRPEMGINNVLRLIGHMTSGVGYRYVLSCDIDDPALPQYRSRMPEFSNPMMLESPNKTVVEAVNAAAAQITDEDLIFNFNDDFVSSSGWDRRLLDFIEQIPNELFLVQPVDMDNGANIPVIQILSRALYFRLGHVLFHGYHAMYADNDLLESARYLGAVYPMTGLGIEHHHPNYGKGKWDETYARENTPHSYAMGVDLLARRRHANFGL